MTAPLPKDAAEVEALNDTFARTHDIDAYYAESSPIIRFIEGRRLATIRRFMSLPRGARLLEIGCGGGHVLRMFPEQQLTGVDVSGEMLEKARRNLAGLDATLLKGDVAQHGLADRSFDGIVCTEVLEHVVDPNHVLAEIARLLAPNGKAVITFPNDRLINAAKTLIRRSGLARVGPLRRIEWGGDHYHFHVWSLAEMRSLLEQRFRIEQESHAPSRIAPVRCCFLVRLRG